MSRHTDPFDPCVCSIGIFQAGTAKGIVAESAHLAGTIRCQKEETRTYIIDNLKRVAQGVAYATGTECDIQVKRGVLGLRNDNDMVDYARSVMDHVVGKAAAPDDGRRGFFLLREGVPRRILLARHAQ